MSLKVEKFSEVMSLILEKSVFGFMDATTAQWRENPVPGWEQYAPIFCGDFVGGLLGLIAVMKRNLTAPVRPPAPDWEQLQEMQKFPVSGKRGMNFPSLHRPQSKFKTWFASEQSSKWGLPNIQSFSIGSNGSWRMEP